MDAVDDVRGAVEPRVGGTCVDTVEVVGGAVGPDVEVEGATV